MTIRHDLTITRIGAAGLLTASLLFTPPTHASGDDDYADDAAAHELVDVGAVIREAGGTLYIDVWGEVDCPGDEYARYDPVYHTSKCTADIGVWGYVWQQCVATKPGAGWAKWRKLPSKFAWLYGSGWSEIDGLTGSFDPAVEVYGDAAALECGDGQKLVTKVGVVAKIEVYSEDSEHVARGTCKFSDHAGGSPAYCAIH